MTHLRLCFPRPAVFPVFLAAALLLSSGCSSSLQKQSVLTGDDNQLTIEPITDTATTRESPVNDPSEFYTRLLAQAGKCCDREEYASADSLCRLVFTAISDGGGLFDSTGAPDRIIQRIIGIYAELLPDTFSAPEELAPQVFHLQLVGALDTMEFTAADSAYVAAVFGSSQKAKYEVPVVWNSRVQRALFYYLTRNKATVERWRERSVTYLPFMKKMFVDSGLPADLAYLPLIESGFNPKAYSRSHASGIWQFIRSTGKRYGLRENYWIDERRDPVLATKAAIRYLKKLYGDFGHWHLALAAYNCGENGLARAIKKYGTDDYWQLRLPAETMNYVPLYIASLAIAKTSDFSRGLSGIADTLPYDTVTVSDCLDLRDIAEGGGIDYDSLRKINPQLLHWCTPPDMSGVQLYLPAGSREAFLAFYADLPDEKKVKWYRYRIRPGDNLGSIARHFGLPVKGIKSVNRMKGTRIIAGKYLFIPIPVGSAQYAVPEEKPPEARQPGGMTEEVPEGAKLTVYEVKPGDTVWCLAELFGVSSKQICGWNKLVNARIRAGQVLSIYSTGGSPEKSAPADETVGVGMSAGRHVVQSGENAFRIAQQNGISIDELCMLNSIDPRNPVIRPGDTLLVKSGVSLKKTQKVPVTPEWVSAAQSKNTVRYRVAEGDNLYRISRNFSIPVERILAINHLERSVVLRLGDTLMLPLNTVQVANAAGTVSDEVVFYTVKNGDNLWRIASNFGISVERLYEYNGLEANSVIMPGDTLRVVTRGEM